MENPGWAGGMPGEKGIDATGAEYAAAEGANPVGAAADVNYMYDGSAPAGHNGTGAGNGY